MDQATFVDLAVVIFPKNLPNTHAKENNVLRPTFSVEWQGGLVWKPVSGK
jgi:hypothetical protein